jgi:hypothetical protein
MVKGTMGMPSARGLHDENLFGIDNQHINWMEKKRWHTAYTLKES